MTPEIKVADELLTNTEERQNEPEGQIWGAD